MITYRGCTIFRTDVTHANSGRPLYAISGRLEKGPAPRPFLTSLRAAKEWINQHDMAAPNHPLYRPVVTPDGRYQSIAAAAEAAGISRQAGHERVQRGTDGWRFEDA
jgi:hypothetical protein